ncbi:MAG: hypothetical protein H0V30_11250 [Chitinophagaceae bacterium]|jgi:hypothetical protein|nr:hypothetical protein [Chitinophagaceae bacterium]
MQSNHFFKAGLMALLLVVFFIAGWEWYWRSKGMPVAFNDDEALWANSRAQVYKSQKESTVFIGSSRIKFDLDIPAWQSLTGEEAIQLAIVGTNPVPLLEDLANDVKFKGKLIIDVTEPLFFSVAPPASASAVKGINYYKKQTPSQKFSSRLNYALESKFVFLEENKYAVNALLSDLEVPNRQGVFSFPVFPKGFEVTNYNRQTYMADDFLNDPKQIKKQTDNWMLLGSIFAAPPIKGDTLTQYLNRVKSAVDKIKSRGGQVLFVRTPASGPMEVGTRAGYPRDQYWDQLLKYTNSPGIHYEDYPETSGFICPEWSHLAPKDAVTYTQHLIKTLRTEKNWSFAKN